MLDAIGEGISIIDEDMKIVWVNPIIEQWAGKLEDLKGKNCYKPIKEETPLVKIARLKRHSKKVNPIMWQEFIRVLIKAG